MDDLIVLSKEERAAIGEALRRYLREELEQEISGLQADLFVDFLSEKIGPVFYNRGLMDAEAALVKKMDDLSDAIHLLEKPLPQGR